MKKRSLFIILIVLVIVACKEEIKEIKPTDVVDLSAYYFPIHDLDKGLVYEYEIIGDTGEVKGLFYASIEPTSTNAFFYKYYNQNFELKDSIYYINDPEGVLVGYRYILFDSVWNRVLFDNNSYFHKNKRSQLDTTKTLLQTMNQYGRLLTNNMKIYFDGFVPLNTPYYDEEQVSVIKIESDLLSKEAGAEQGVGFQETTTVYNAKGIGTIKNINVNEFGTTTFLLKRVMKKKEFTKLKMN